MKHDTFEVADDGTLVLIDTLPTGYAYVTLADEYGTKSVILTDAERLRFIEALKP